MAGFWQDLRFGLRMLMRSPGFAGVAILTLALGIGANTTVFSVINTVLLRRLPYADPERLVLVWANSQKEPGDINILSAPNFLDWQKQNDVFERMAIFDSVGKGYDISGDGGGEAERISGVRVTASFFDVLGVKPLLGRTFSAEEETQGKDRVVVLAASLWKRRFTSDPAIIGKTIRMEGANYTVIGVMPPEFQFQFWSNSRELWVPLGYTESDRDRTSNSFVCIARLKPGVTLEQARTEMDTIGRRLAQQYPVDNVGKSATVRLLSLHGMRNMTQTLRTLFIVVGFVLLIACVNVANLMLARSTARQKELATRRALGASAFRMVRQLLTESLMLSLLGGIAGLFVAAAGTGLVEQYLPNNLKFLAFRPITTIPMSGRVFVFTFLAACVTGILFGFAPALSALRGDLNDPLKGGGGRGATQSKGNRLRHALVAVEVALALAVLAGTGMMVETMARLLAVNPGFDAKNVLTMDLSQPQKEIYSGPPGNARFCRDLEDHVGSLPGIISVSSDSHLPLEGNAGRGFTIEGLPDPGPEKQPGAAYSVICPGYFRTMGIPLLAGREFNHQDANGAPGVIIVNETMANKFWPNQHAVGKRIKYGFFDSKLPWMTIVGVAGDVRHWGLDEEVKPEFFRPYPQAGWPFMTVIVRTASAPSAFGATVKEAMTKMDPDHPISNLVTMEEVVHDSVGSRRFPMLLLAAFGFLALALAAVGIGGVVSYAVVQRTHEIGIRMALGAQPRDVLRLVVGGNMAWALAGVAIGVGAAIWLTRLLTGLLYGVQPGDPFVLGAVCLVLASVALIACYVPARRAAKVDPVVALRFE